MNRLLLTMETELNLLVDSTKYVTVNKMAQYQETLLGGEDNMRSSPWIYTLLRVLITSIEEKTSSAIQKLTSGMKTQEQKPTLHQPLDVKQYTTPYLDLSTWSFNKWSQNDLTNEEFLGRLPGTVATPKVGHEIPLEGLHVVLRLPPIPIAADVEH
jgi:hypothetical protein